MRKQLYLFVGLIILVIVPTSQELYRRSERKKRAVAPCKFNRKAMCERNVRCTFIVLPGCVRVEQYECTEEYEDCCKGDVMDNGICYPPDEPCDDCYTLTDCEGEVSRLDSRFGVISSKNYPNNYAPNQDCTWTIRGSRNSTIFLQMIDFRIEQDQDCVWDWVQGRYDCRKKCNDFVRLDDGFGNSLQECGTVSNFDRFTTRGSTAVIKFHSDDSGSSRGFQLIYTVSGGRDPSPETTTSPTTAEVTTPQPTTREEIISRQTTSPKPSEQPESTDEDNPVCPGKLIWSNCPKCTRTCNNYNQDEDECVISFFGSSSGAVNRRCRPGCVCPDEFPIWHKLRCVKSAACKVPETPPPVPDGPNPGAKSQPLNVCKLLALVRSKCLRTCDNIAQTEEECVRETKESAGVIDGYACACHPGKFMIAGKCVTKEACRIEQNKRCQGGEVWVESKPQCEKTCDPTNQRCALSSASGDPGCACPEDRPIKHKGICVSKAECPADQNVVCGKQHYQPIIKIVGGDGAVKGSWPWMVQLEKMQHGSFALACGGTLICERWVLTASHCFLSPGKLFLDKKLTKYRVHIGKHFKEFNHGDAASGMLANITPKRIITHEKYDLSTHVNDIALIELPVGVKMSRFIRPACIHNYTDDYHPLATKREKCISAGWGAETNTDVNFPGNHVRVLKQVDLEARLHNLCSNLFFHFDVMKMHCVGGHRNEDTCAGDSGGPLMCLRGDRWYVDGVVSFGLKCGVKDQPGVYTRVPRYSPWIYGYTGKQCGSPDIVYPAMP